MNVVGIVCEYNPFHNGHKYHIEQAKQITGADAVVCVMSGNYVQRGEPAVLNKWTRARLALEHGADVVIEIPTVYCLGNASFYARASVKLLESLGNVKSICFGTEASDISELKVVSDRLRNDSKEINALIQANTKKGLSYPAARMEAYKALYGEGQESLEGSNNVLAIEYLKSIEKLEPFAVKRLGSGYNDDVDSSKVFQSSTGIRNKLKAGETVSEYVPYDTDVFSEMYSGDETAFGIIRHMLLSITPEDIDRAPSGGEGIGNRLIEAARSAKSIDDLIQNTKSKRYTYTRISRLIYQLMLGITRDMLDSEPEYIRILGFTDKGREVLREVKREELNTLPIIQNINKLNQIPSQLSLDIHASDVYNLCAGRDIVQDSDYKISPIISK